MSSSSSIGSKVMRRFNPPQRTHCDCGDLVGRWTSWKTRNPGRRFIGCPNYRDSSKDCKFFDWVDPPLPNQCTRTALTIAQWVEWRCCTTNGRSSSRSCSSSSARCRWCCSKVVNVLVYFGFMFWFVF
ncbi:unnamed protein product [Lactuca saligna]|uniref:GRF-type domain-containing protein n=1 Tax=Lactuca saligna TaxID=75948 RepID=A0AA35V044_LACSI|nr:unnamed protein product [Lactuca saligna]